MKRDVSILKIDCENKSVSVESEDYSPQTFCEALKLEMTKSEMIATILALKPRDLFKMSREDLLSEYMRNHPLYGE